MLKFFAADLDIRADTLLHHPKPISPVIAGFIAGDATVNQNLYVTRLPAGARMFYEGTHWEFDCFGFLEDCLSASILSRDSCVYLRHTYFVARLP
jgi:hypothetical protein